MEQEWFALNTESWDQSIPDLGTLSNIELVQIMNRADKTVAETVEKSLPDIAQAIDMIVAQFRLGGRLFYVGAGTSGRLGVLDAAECPPTFNTAPDMVQALIAGGHEAIFEAQEGAEDNHDQGGFDLRSAGARVGDVVVGIAASGSTPYVMGALTWARAEGLVTISISCNPDPPIAAHSDVAIAMDTGPEVVMGSTRLKAGTAQKMVLNMLSTGAMVGLGKTYRNLMVDMRPTNRKLKARSVRIVALAANLTLERARQLLDDSNGDVKVAIAMALLGTSALEAEARLTDSQGILARL